MRHLKNFKWLLPVICALLLVGGYFSLQPAKVAHATTYFVPPSWNGEQCDNTHFNNATGLTGSYAAAPLGGNFMGIYACGPRPSYHPPTYTDPETHYDTGGTLWGEFEFECVELSMRFMYLVYGTNPYDAPGGADVYYNYTKTTRTGVQLTQVANSTTGQAPHPGDIIGYGPANDPVNGHTSVVTAVTPTGGTGNYSVTVMEQNGQSNGWDTLTMSSWTLDGGNSGHSVDGRLTPSASVNPGVGARLFGVKAIASNNVYGVGYYDPNDGIHSSQALVEKYSGSSYPSWSQITSGNAADYNVQLDAVDASSSSNLWAVGMLNNPTSHSYVLKYNGTSWTKVTSEPDIGNLSAVKVFSSSNVWVAGESGQVAHFTGGTSWTTYTPTNVLHLYAIDADGTSDVWVAGDNTNGKAYVGKWTGGSNFTEVSSEPNPANNSGDTDTLTGIHVFSSSNVWVSAYAIPSQTFIQYGYVAKWDGSSWTTNSFPGNTSLNGISASSTSNIRVVGWSGVVAYVEKSTGDVSTWTSLLTPANSQFLAVSALSSDGSSWAVGYDNTVSPSRTTVELLL